MTYWNFLFTNETSSIIKPCVNKLNNKYVNDSFKRFACIGVLALHVDNLETIARSTSNCSQVTVHLGWRWSQNQITNSSLGNLNILVGTENVNLLIGQYYPRFGHVFNCKFSPASFTSQSSNRSVQVITLPLKEKKKKLISIQELYPWWDEFSHLLVMTWHLWFQMSLQIDHQDESEPGHLLLQIH